MAATAQPNIGTKEGYTAGDNGWVGDFNYLNRAIDGLVQASIKAILNTPPVSPVRGDCYIVATGTGPWTGWDGRFVRYTGSAWESWIPKDGWYVYNQADAIAYRRKSGAWVVDDFLPKNNPTFTGTLTGPTATLSGSAQEVLKLRRSGATVGLVYGVDFQGQTDDLTWVNYARLQARLASTANGAQTGNLRMLIYDAGASKIALDATPSWINFGTGVRLTFDGTTVVDSSRNGSFAGLTASGTLKAKTTVDASSFQWTPNAAEGLSFFGSTSSANDGAGYHSMVLHSNDSEAAGRSLGFVTFGQKVSDKSGNYPGLKAFIRCETYGSGGSVGGFGGRVVIAARGDNESLPSDIASFDKTKVVIVSGIPLYQGATERITAGGDGRFTSLRASSLAASSTYLTRLDANGELVASPVKVSSGVGVVFEQPASLQVAGGAWGGSSYTSWSPSAVVPLADDTSGNAMSSLGTGYLWNSQRLNALTITDGANATPYRGRIKADRWVAYSTLIIQNTTAATSWFAAGSGDGSPTIPANYLKAGRRVRVEGRIFCPSCAANTAPEIVLKVGATTLWTRSKAFTIAAGNEIFIDVRANIFIDDGNRLIVVGDVELSAVATGVYNFKQGGQIDPYNGTTSNTIDVTVKPSSTSETWVRSFAFIEI